MLQNRLNLSESIESSCTCRPTRIFLVSAPCGNDAWTMGTVLLDSKPPSGPMWLDSCLIRDTTAKYWGKSLVTMRQMRFFSNSAGLSSSVRGKYHTKRCDIWPASLNRLNRLNKTEKKNMLLEWKSDFLGHHLTYCPRICSIGLIHLHLFTRIVALNQMLDHAAERPFLYLHPFQ